MSLSNRVQYMLDCYCYVPVQKDTVHAGLLLLCPRPTGYNTLWNVTAMSLSNRIQYTLDCYCYVPVQQDWRGEFKLEEHSGLERGMLIVGTERNGEGKFDWRNRVDWRG